LLFDETDKPYLDIDSLKSNDVDYENIRQLYDYTKIFYQKHMKKEKKYWKDNSELQQKIFKFLN